MLGLTDVELQVRAENRLKRRLKEARFSLMKTLDTFEFEKAVGLDARQIQELSTGEYIRQHQHVIFLGKSGTGKTHLATGLGVEACKEGFRTRFVTGCGLVNELVEAQEERVLNRLLKCYASYDLFIHRLRPAQTWAECAQGGSGTTPFRPFRRGRIPACLSACRADVVFDHSLVFDGRKYEFPTASLFRLGQRTDQSIPAEPDSVLSQSHTLRTRKTSGKNGCSVVSWRRGLV